MANCGCEIDIKSTEESKVLIILLLINAVMFITAGVLVAYFSSAIPDLTIGCIISAVIIRGSIQIINETKVAYRSEQIT
jgi:Co/Zn/Cd efflux system component